MPFFIEVGAHVATNELDAACKVVRQATHLSPSVAIILGSGLGELAQYVEHPVAIPFSDLPGFARTTAAGHRGQLLVGYLGGCCVAVLQGRYHLYEGHSIERATFPVHLMHRLGAETLIVSNASGGINPRFSSGEVVLIDSHIHLMMRSSFAGSMISSEHRSMGNVHRHGDVYDPVLSSLAKRLAIRSGFALQSGTYLATLGPNYETRSEYRFFRKLGADMVGMSTVPEVLTAAALGMKVLGFSVVTNVAQPDALAKTDHSEVLDWANAAQQRLLPLVKSILSTLSGHPD